MDKEKILADLFEMQDIDYRDFQCRLMPTVPREHVIGVRTPLLRAYARSFDREKAEAFMAELPHRYYEENNLHAFLIERLGEWQTTVDALDRFLPYVDNWATCDGRAATLVAKHPAQAQDAAVRWLQSDREYTVRFGLVTLLSFVKTDFVPEHLMLAARPVLAGPCQTAYYVRMAAAWYFSMALVHQWDAALPWIVENRLPVWVHNKTVQKACESYQLTQAQKQLLRGCKRPDKEE